jgi:hypothetical protein
LEVGQKMAQVDDGALYPIDILASAVLHRSTNLIRGFATLVEQRNFICAAALLRLQIDNCLRFYAVYLVKEPHTFAMEIMKGSQVRKMQDRSGALLTDQYLVGQLSQHHPWIENVYKQTSGYVHLSEKHVYNIFASTSSGANEDGVQNVVIGHGDSFGTDALYEEATAAFIEATKLLFHYLIGWIKTKELRPSAPPSGCSETAG